MDADEAREQELVDDVVGEVEDEPSCEESSEPIVAGDEEPVDVETSLAPEEEEELDELLDEIGDGYPGDEWDHEDRERRVPRGLGPPGGGWGGAQAPVQRAMRVGVRNGLKITSNKRNWGSTGSDHHASQRTSYAADMSNGSKPTPQMDRTARQLAAMLGYPGWRGGVLNAQFGRYRVQLLWRTKIGGDHYNHVHLGLRMK